MNRVFGIILMLLLIAGPSSLLFADEGIATTTVGDEITTYRLSVGEKFARGIKNILLGWTEIPLRMVDITNESNDPVKGAVFGLFQGTLKAIARTGSGICDVVTAPIAPDKGPLMSPEIDVE